MADEDAKTLARAISLHRSGTTDQAIRQYRAVLRRHPGHVEALRLIAHAYGQIGARRLGGDHCPQTGGVSPLLSSVISAAAAAYWFTMR
jgi:hypothetical protein